MDTQITFPKGYTVQHIDPDPTRVLSCAYQKTMNHMTLMEHIRLAFPDAKYELSPTTDDNYTWYSGVEFSNGGDNLKILFPWTDPRTGIVERQINVYSGSPKTNVSGVLERLIVALNLEIKKEVVEDPGSPILATMRKTGKR